MSPRTLQNGCQNSVSTPAGVIRPTLEKPLSHESSCVNQRFPSGPVTMNFGWGYNGWEISMTTPSVVMRPIIPERLNWAEISVNQRLPSGPAVIPWGLPPTGRTNSVMAWPAPEPTGRQDGFQPFETMRPEALPSAATQETLSAFVVPEVNAITWPSGDHELLGTRSALPSHLAAEMSGLRPVPSAFMTARVVMYWSRPTVSLTTCAISAPFGDHDGLK